MLHSFLFSKETNQRKASQTQNATCDYGGAFAHCSIGVRLGLGNLFNNFADGEMGRDDGLG